MALHFHRAIQLCKSHQGLKFVDFYFKHRFCRLHPCIKVENQRENTGAEAEFMLLTYSPGMKFLSRGSDFLSFPLLWPPVPCVEHPAAGDQGNLEPSEPSYTIIETFIFLFEILQPISECLESKSIIEDWKGNDSHLRLPTQGQDWRVKRLTHL